MLLDRHRFRIDDLRLICIRIHRLDIAWGRRSILSLLTASQSLSWHTAVVLWAKISSILSALEKKLHTDTNCPRRYYLVYPGRLCMLSEGFTDGC